MKKILFGVFLFFSSLIYSQERKDSVLVDTLGLNHVDFVDSTLQIKLDSLSEEIEKLIRDNLKLTESLGLLRQDSIKIDSLNRSLEYRLNAKIAESEQMDSINKDLSYYLEVADVRLFNVSNNFLYIPYEAYSIEKIAIPAYEAIYNDERKEKHKIRYTLLKEYRHDIESFVLFLEKSQEELFDYFATQDVADEWRKNLKQENFYINYSSYEDGDNTYLGAKLKKVDELLGRFNRDNKELFTPIINELKVRLKTVEDL